MYGLENSITNFVNLIYFANEIFFEGYQFFSLIYLYVCYHLVGRVLGNDPGDESSISGRFIAKTQKLVLNAALLNSSY